ncbi:MAG TPA: hypothetical protein VLC93_11880, partial [Myxococcota bacterium]|nr:hypothetical protein [Myxococcota bacterium]
MLAVVFAVSIVGVHYEHPQRHFSVELPKDWAPVEPLNDPAGIIFHRNTNDRLTISTIRAVPVGDATLQDFVLAIAAASQGEPGYVSVASGPTTLAGAVGYRRRFTLFIDPNGQFTKTVEERVAIIDGIGYVVRVEGFTHWFNQRSRDTAQIFKTFATPGSARPASLRSLPCPFR